MISTNPPEAATSVWGTELLDLPAYLDRIGRPAPAAPTAETLRLLHRAHVEAVPFENIDVFLGRELRLDPAGLQAKMRPGRGGYCYEQNLLFGAVLERLGHRVERQLARVRIGADRVRPRTHAMLVVHADGGRWLADVGFGAEGLLEPLPLVGGATVTVGARTWDLTHHDGDWVLRAVRPDGPVDLYTFREERHHPADFQMANHYTATSSRSPFLGALVAQRSGPRVRHTLRDLRLTEATPDGTAERDIAPGELAGVLRETFGIVPDAEDERAIIARLAAAPA
ncbi:arylamine N-acetyltransferase [Sphaerisporangium rufum]|uniref:Arylamine N-acetyltransferase n=1 Tax=Sphaerisporangium rufum TaxID=1381558 RepID=A0A919R885_9ACTN|nr:arylamine N-acetyltransferase [Sphaerisporangium rufum]GII81467.1 arylamine N-acetyltransferase [Sphaerisporangium rufum]